LEKELKNMGVHPEGIEVTLRGAWVLGAESKAGPEGCCGFFMILLKEDKAGK